MNPLFGTLEPTRKAKIGGEVVSYDLCSENRNAYSDCKNARYIGKGFIYTINGVDNSSETPYHFFTNAQPQYCQSWEELEDVAIKRFNHFFGDRK